MHYSAALAVEYYADACANRAEAWWDFRMDDNCISDAGEALRLDPQYAYANEIMGRCLTELDRLDEAIGYFDTAISLASGYQNAYRNKMAALAMLGRYEEVVAVADLALAPGTVPNPNPAIEEDILSRRLLALAKYATPADLAKESEALLQKYPDSLAAINIKARALLADQPRECLDPGAGDRPQSVGASRGGLSRAGVSASGWRSGGGRGARATPAGGVACRGRGFARE